MGHFFHKHRQVISYIFWGGATTVVNFAVYFVSTGFFAINYLTANIAAWIVSVLFAFAVNKLFVFDSKDWHCSKALPEFGKFVGARVVSGFAETALLWLFVDICGLHDGIIKIFVSILVVISNYIFSKLFIFRNRR